MAITKSTYTGNGSTTQYTFSFPYLSEDDVVVKVASVVVSNYSFANSSTILFTSAPANGASIEIIRDTNIDQAEATFFSGSAIRAEDLNTNFTQTFYAVQETDNEVTGVVSNASTALTTANTALSTANTAATDATTAVTIASTALSTANTASTAAANATTTANQASTLASSANTTANSAVTTANSAVTTANTAASDAASAVTTANTASSNASAAVTTANTANTNASAAVTTANTASTNASAAVTTANTANTTANTALDNANDAVTLADRAINLGAKSFGDLYASISGSAGSKTIDLGNLTTGCANDHFTGEAGGTSAYTCALGCSTFALGTL
jgi:hypothetical protein